MLSGHLHIAAALAHIVHARIAHQPIPLADRAVAEHRVDEPLGEHEHFAALLAAPGAWESVLHTPAGRSRTSTHARPPPPKKTIHADSVHE
jgi:hypothetical protein